MARASRHRLVFSILLFLSLPLVALPPLPSESPAHSDFLAVLSGLWNDFGRFVVSFAEDETPPQGQPADPTSDLGLGMDPNG